MIRTLTYATPQELSGLQGLVLEPVLQIRILNASPILPRETKAVVTFTLVAVPQKIPHRPWMTPPTQAPPLRTGRSNVTSRVAIQLQVPHGLSNLCPGVALHQENSRLPMLH